MDYRTIINSVRRLDFIKDDQTAESVVKSVLGTITNRLPEQQAKTLTENLPDQFNYEMLRHSTTPGVSGNVSMPEFVHKLGQQYNLDDNRARQVVTTVLHTCEEVIGKDRIGMISQNLPSDWADAFRNYEPPNTNMFPGEKKRNR